MSEYIVDGAVPNRTVRVEDEREVYWHMTHLPVREEIVRCRDCKHCREHDMRAYGADRNQLLCHHFSMSSGAGWPVEPDGYCAWGERRDA